jgi:hypothetical protein
MKRLPWTTEIIMQTSHSLRLVVQILKGAGLLVSSEQNQYFPLFRLFVFRLFFLGFRV